MWDLPGPGLEPVSPALAGGFLTTEPPGKPDRYGFNVVGGGPSWIMDGLRYRGQESMLAGGMSKLLGFPNENEEATPG